METRTRCALGLAPWQAAVATLLAPALLMGALGIALGGPVGDARDGYGTHAGTPAPTAVPRTVAARR